LVLHNLGLYLYELIGKLTIFYFMKLLQKCSFGCALGILTLFSNQSNAQLQLLLDPVNSVQTSSLFNLSLVNSSSSSSQVVLTASLRSKRGKELMRQTLTIDSEANGMKSVRGVQATQTTFFDNQFQSLYQSNGTLPPLNYVLCVTANSRSDQNLKTEECTNYEATDFINLTALYPSDDLEIYEQRPQFNWMDLVPNAAYTYNFRLVEVAAGQNPNAAMRRNSPIVSKENLREKQLLFPSDAPPLENKKTYAWQLDINYQGEKVATSDAWQFTYEENIEYIDFPKDLSYVDITELERGASLYAVGEFKFKYPSDISNELEVELFELKKDQKKKIELTDYQFTVKLGINKYELDLKEQVYLKHLKDYSLVLKDRQTNQSYQFSIKYINPDYIK